MKPMMNQIPHAIHVRKESCEIKNRHNKNDKIGSTGKNGTLKPPDGIFLCLRKNTTPMDTIVNATKVPIFTNSASLESGTKPAQKATSNANIHVFFTGVLNLGLSSAMLFGSKPSRPKANSRRVPP